MIIKCPECQGPLSSRAIICPHCGYPANPDIIPLRSQTYHGYDNEISCTFKQPARVKDIYEMWTETYFRQIQNSSTRTVRAAWAYCSSVYDIRISDIRIRHIKDCMENGTAVVRGRERHPSPAMKSKIKSLFNLMFDYAMEYEIVERNYARCFKLSDELVRAANSVKREHIAFADDELTLLWQHADGSSFADAILIQCYSGWRPQELARLELKNVDLKNHSFLGGMKTESGTGRLVPIHSKIMPLVLRRYQEAKTLGSPYLFNCPRQSSKTKETHLTYSRYRTAFMNIRNELHLNPIHRPHDGRTHFVTAAKRAGVDEYAIKYMVGHKISDITERVYTKREFHWLRDELEKIK